MKIANSDVYSGANYSYQKELATAGAGTSGFFAGIVEKHVEKEKSDYKASGKVQTEDGRDIKVEVNVSMARKKERDTFIAMSSPLNNLFDPLIINTKAQTSGLSDKKFKFDLDADGKQDEISMTKSGSGFLALDKNGDGKINDGTELFGVKSGDGFKDLADYDTDGNGWIDENDEVFEKLKVWSKTENGKDELKCLKESGVGAIFLGAENTEFTIEGEDGVLDGKVRKTGIFLKEDGTAGTIQHVDLAIKGRESELMSAAEKLDEVLEKMRSERSQRNRRNNNNDNARRRAQKAKQKKLLEDYQKKQERKKELTEQAIERHKRLYET
ncbi:hypothetical protein SAMN02745229_01399 [Butyrivibrio fibrisolvens DSM 3071]|uniref:EF-hand domain-containing protein n=1 Tax=Butyrivibrio fibrisolvens DSM 3071 TaxID=1121131 RepID=A0A1M5XYB4_BUTFI|nr:hypothetical protein [Butyrivibrio fibrisolvens]SHI04716.1 hypothetical protein SAMN02745229_01399 [Butyrivibrio fibrisolvens DSM 3071]